MSKTQKTSTSIKVSSTLYEDFRISSVKSKVTLHDIVEKSLYCYMTDPEFRKRLHSVIHTHYTGSDNPINIK